jgi:hypothetical protein
MVGASAAKLGALSAASETSAVAIRSFFMVPPGDKSGLAQVLRSNVPVDPESACWDDV